jgi:hypothetical protein
LRQQSGFHNRRQSEFYLGHTEHRIGAGQAHVARRHDLQASTQTESVDPGDGWHWKIAQNLAHSVHQSDERE